MLVTGERAYAYAKACGIIRKSFVGKRIHAIAQAGKLYDLDRMVFPDEPKGLPEKELLHNIEKRIMGRSANSIISIVKCFSDPPEFLILLIRSYEYSDLFSAISASLDKRKTAPAHVDLGRFQTVRFGAWPNIKAMVKGTHFEFLLHENEIFNSEHGINYLQSILDRHFYNALWKSVFSLPERDRLITEKILSDEISLKNSSWALRLRTYYKMPERKVKDHLVDIQSRGSRRLGIRKRSLAEEALQCLNYPLDSYLAWSSWRWKKFLNPPDSEQWRADPRYFQNAAARYLYRLAGHYFHFSPFSLDSIFCFIKLKQFEEDILTSCAEGLGMGMSARDSVSVLKVGQ